ncbi:MAG: sugar phosphate isomerase/epimerase [Chloroflexi bacterium]|nr:sugar phosphate isomerase/epimerase [Chloroflexota bacterium]
MRLLLGSTILLAYNVEEALRLASHLGYDGVEVWAYHMYRSGESPSQVARIAKHLGLSLTVHALSWDLNITSDIPSLRQESLALLEKCVELTAALGASLLVVHPGRVTVPKADKASYWPLLVEGIQRLARKGVAYNIVIAVEHMEPLEAELLVQPMQVHQLLEEVDEDNVCVTFDAAHVPMGVHLVHFLEQLPAVKHVHISDADQDQRHLPLGSGRLNLKDLLHHLRQSNYQRFVVVEGIEHRRIPHLARQNKEAFDELLKL